MRAELGESPVWDPATGHLHWVDLWGGRVHSTDVTSGLTTSVAVDAPVSAVVAVAGGGLIACRGDQLVRPGAEVLVGGLAAPGTRLNDAAVDPDGTLWFGTMGWTAADTRPGALLRFRDGRASVALNGTGLANGIAWSPDGRTLWFADSARGTVSAYRVARVLGPPLVVIAVPGVPDGLCVDADGGVWVALFGGGALHRYAPDGELVGVLRLSESHPTNCAFGGPGLDELYVTTARRSSTSSGALLRVDPGVTGVPTTPVRLDHLVGAP
ncbi:SMP-30/gluconolactonase/LRE family protein [Actinokineospora sp. HUAS TT18]|uniref:SMP-30/gluconolactonase/LRE family protein n=1 Tax=Actinokineospora sp. HUAS TT18 TaxID=3447451 RepID=UPI003F51DE56